MVCRILGPPQTWKIARSHLDRFQQHVFQDEGGLLQEHRVTLFKWVKWKLWMWPWRGRYWPWGSWGTWPWSGWLVPVVRSRHTTQKSSTVFLAPDDASLAEGVAGRAWGTGEVVVVNDLPDLSKQGTDGQIRTYADSTWVTTEWVRTRVRRGRHCARSLCGFTIEVKGTPWGVIVLDSKKAELQKTDDIMGMYRLVAQFLGAVLQETAR